MSELDSRQSRKNVTKARRGILRTVHLPTPSVERDIISSNSCPPPKKTHENVISIFFIHVTVLVVVPVRGWGLKPKT